jgi:hypothetical protein
MRMRMSSSPERALTLHGEDDLWMTGGNWSTGTRVSRSGEGAPALKWRADEAVTPQNFLRHRASLGGCGEEDVSMSLPRCKERSGWKAGVQQGQDETAQLLSKGGALRPGAGAP